MHSHRGRMGTRNKDYKVNSQLSSKILVLGYFFLASLYLYASINNAIDNLTSNRTIGAIILLSYSIFMLIGLIKNQRIFGIISFINFLILFVFLVYFIILGLPTINTFLALMLMLSTFGLFLSLNSLKKK